MTIIANENSYVTIAEYQEWRAQRGFSVLAEGKASQGLTLAMDWLESRSWSGNKADESQSLQFPRGTGTVPNSIKTAQMWLAHYSTQFDLFGGGEIGRVVSKTEGDLSVTYASGTKWDALDAFPIVANLIGSLLQSEFVMPLLRY